MSDDAGNRLRGLRAESSERLLDLVGQRYDLDGVDEARDLGGSSNLNLLVASGGDRCVVRVYRPYVDTARLDAIQTVRRALANGGVPTAETIPTRDGAGWTAIDDRLVEVERFVEHDHDMNTWERIEQGLPWLGRIHSLLRAADISTAGRQPLFANHIEPPDVLERTLRGTRRVRGWGPSPNELRLAEAAEELASRVAEAESEFLASAVRQMVHGDFWDNNVLFGGEHVVLVTDFDFMGERSRTDDLALTLYYASSDFSVDPGSIDWVARLRLLVDAYERGLDNPLSAAERAALPLAIARQPLWWIGGWLAVLDDEGEARRGFAGMSRDVMWALCLARDAGRCQAAFV